MKFNHPLWENLFERLSRFTSRQGEKRKRGPLEDYITKEIAFFLLAIQVYIALIAGLLLAAFTGKQPTKRAMELIQFHFMGYIDDDELRELLKFQKKQSLSDPIQSRCPRLARQRVL